MKTLSDVKSDMSDLYDQVKAGKTDLKIASELANITGKFLKAVQLDLAQEIFLSSKGAQAVSPAPVVAEQPVKPALTPLPTQIAKVGGAQLPAKRLGDKVWCKQCDSLVAVAQVVGCKSAICSAKESV